MEGTTHRMQANRKRWAFLVGWLGERQESVSDAARRKPGTWIQVEHMRRKLRTDRYEQTEHIEANLEGAACFSAI